MTRPMDQPARLRFVDRAFRTRFGGPPTAWFRAPGRVDLMGSHTDYNDGHVLTMTVDRDTWLAVRPREDRSVVIASLDLPGEGAFELDAIEPDPDVPWTDYVRGSAAVLQDEGHTLVGFDGLLHSTVPFGSGLSSSAAIEIASLLAFAGLAGIDLEPVELALLGQRAENEFVGVSCGILDQYTSVLGRAGHALLLDCRELNSRPVAMAAHLAVVICDTRAERSLAATGYDERRAQCEAGVAILRRFDSAIRALRDVSLPFLAAHEPDLPPVVARRCQIHRGGGGPRPRSREGPAGRGPGAPGPAPGRVVARRERAVRDRGTRHDGDARGRGRRTWPHRPTPGGRRLRGLPRGPRRA